MNLSPAPPPALVADPMFGPQLNPAAAGAPEGDLKEDADEILTKITEFETTHSIQLYDFNRFYKMYRGIPDKSRRENQSNTFLPETFVEVEAIATAIHEMVFSDNSDASFFDVTPEENTIDDVVRAQVSKATLIKQLKLTEFAHKMLPYFRMLCLHGNYPAETPWKLAYKSYWDNLSRVRRPAFDCWDFEPFNIVNFAFDDVNDELEEMEWCARTMHVRPKAAMEMARMGLWNEQVVRDTIGKGIARNRYEIDQRQAAGYVNLFSQGKGLTAKVYYGTLESRKDNEIYWAEVTSEGEFLKEPEINLYAHGEKPFLFGRWFTLPDEPFAMGLGHINNKTQSEINDRRNFVNDLLYASLYNMWLMRSDAGIQLPSNKMRYSPHQIIIGDQISDDFFRALRPDLGSLTAAINLENADIDKMRRNSGATTTLQAVATGITATEAQSIQSEATRRIKAMIRCNVANILRKMLERAHMLNIQFLDRPISAKFTTNEGMEVFGKVTRQDLLMNPWIEVKMSTDLDFRPFKRQELLQMLQIFGQLKQNGLMGGRNIIPDPIIEELAQTYGMDPRKFFQDPRAGILETMTRQATQNPQAQAQAMQQMVANSPAAQALMSQQAQGVGAPPMKRPYPLMGANAPQVQT